MLLRVFVLAVSRASTVASECDCWGEAPCGDVPVFCMVFWYCLLGSRSASLPHLTGSVTLSGLGRGHGVSVTSGLLARKHRPWLPPCTER